MICLVEMTMSNIKVSELFYSLQGEGRYTGVPSVFLRTFGCNFKCRNFGRTGDNFLADGEENPDVAAIALTATQFKLYEDLPLAATGCDSYAAVYPEFKSFSPSISVDDIVQQTLELLPYKHWEDEHFVITGGEPLLGWQRVYPELLGHPYMTKLKHLTFETNGTQKLTVDFKDYLNLDWMAQHGRHSDNLTFSVSPKLSCSGEHAENAIRPDIIVDYESVGFTYLKFVVATEADAEEALEAVDIYRAEGFEGPAYLMPVGGTVDSYTLNKQRVAELAMKMGLRYSDRLHTALWGNQWGT